MKSAPSKNFFLISFLPAIAYWYLDENYPVKIALAGGLILAVIEVLIEKIFTKHVHTISKFNFFLILLLGALSFLGDDGVWFKLQPLFTGIGMSAFMFYRLKRGKGLLLEMMESMPQKKNVLLPDFVFQMMEWHMAFFLLGYGIFMAVLAIYASTGTWAFFKTIGFYLAFAVYMVIEFVMIKRVMNRLKYQSMIFQAGKSQESSPDDQR
ncbi:MAG: hypothetical protein COW00_08535 [Bdellovibrio sp. CG12_big_fil_rev_8_21_14_0_65_39_13]|nr:MAG: hypothetical protein COW78_08605 [Bdellovibrio sp. CG22_combo_CG10-13_8_21_14_all_39_27]PIQ59671.1 MAG: hypothetical protein COW00_08535 [Bdellovibrio sp. CG12_big_fil_rev_8_21_14_0_65_39_13]PIR36296.1 MAG: hypothetical protein COV37_04845 [Bdellovibrio sp. CG11_big_fil_rev_8_21_14_0_20_39_38]